MDLKWMNFWGDFGAEDAGRLTPFKDDKLKDTENSPFEASSVLVVKAKFWFVADADKSETLLQASSRQ